MGIVELVESWAEDFPDICAHQHKDLRCEMEKGHRGLHRSEFILTKDGGHSTVSWENKVNP